MFKRVVMAGALIVGMVLVGQSAAFAEVTVGQAAPDFTLADLAGNQHSLSSYKGRFVVLEWTNYDCPFVKKHYDSGNMQELQDYYTAEDVVWLSINSSASGKQGHFTVEEWHARMEKNEAMPTAVLLDADGAVGRLYGAKTTPHMFIIDPEGTLIYQGAIDDNPSANPEDILDSYNYVAGALDEAMDGDPVSFPTTQPYGCSVKY